MKPSIELSKTTNFENFNVYCITRHGFGYVKWEKLSGGKGRGRGGGVGVRKWGYPHQMIQIMWMSEIGKIGNTILVEIQYI